MFENIIGHETLTRTLRRQLDSGSYPSASLLYGPRFAGKLSIALEIARVLTCHRRAEWSCGCPSCRKQRLLVHPNTVQLGSRYFELEIAASADVLRRTRRRASQYLFVRAVRKLTRRFDPFLWEGEETKVRSLQPVLAELEEILDELAPGPDGPAGDTLELTERALETRLEKIQALSLKAAAALSTDTIPINQIRRAAAWLHMSALNAPASEQGGARKILILENADRMQEASSNSLLKLLEEPPPEARVILIATRRGSLIPTVRSRLRPYHVAERSSAEDDQVLQRIFHEEEADYQDLRQYFLYWKDVNPQQLERMAQRFLAAALSAEGQEEGVLLELAKTLDSPSGRSFAGSLLEELLRQLLGLLRAGALDSSRLGRANRAIREHAQALEDYNQNATLVVESLFYDLRAAE